MATAAEEEALQAADNRMISLPVLSWQCMKAMGVMNWDHPCMAILTAPVTEGSRG